jgi:hypothetical protein
MSKLNSLQTYLETTGKALTTSQIRAMFKISNPTAAVHALRLRGVCVYANKSSLSDGTSTTRYRVGNASTNLVAFAAAAGFFSS